MFEIFQHEFMVRALIAGVAVAAVAPVIGMFLVVRRYAYIADTLAHVSFVGVAVSVLVGVHPVIGATLTSLAAALGIEYLRVKKRLAGEAVLSIFLSASLALALVLMSLSRGSSITVTQALFGSITTILPSDVLLILGLTVVVGLVVLFLYKEFFLIAADEELAQAEGLKVSRFTTMLMMLTGITIAIAMRTVGILLIGALMVIPALTAIQFGKGFRVTLFFATIISVVATVVGLVVSYYANIPTGATIVLIAVLLFLGSLGFQRSS